MGKVTLIYIGFCFFAFILQLFLAPWMSIKEIRPDFVLLAILFIGRLEGRLKGQLYGFFMGLFVDLIGLGSFLGLSALAKTIAGFFAGYLKDQKNRLSLVSFYAFNVILIFAHYAIFYFINFKGAELTTQVVLLRYITPATIYTAIFYILIDLLFVIEAR